MSEAAVSVETTQAPALVEMGKALRKAQEHRRLIAERERLRDEMILELRSQIEMENDGSDADTAHDRHQAAFWQAQAEVCFRRYLAENPKARKSYRLAPALIEARKPPAQAAEPKDGTPEAQALWTWAEEHGLIRETVTREWDWSAIRALALHGEEVPGVTVSDDAEDKVTVKWNERRREETEG